MRQNLWVKSSSKFFKKFKSLLQQFKTLNLDNFWIISYLNNWMTTTCWVYPQLVNTCCVTMNCWLIVNVPWSPVSLNPAEHKNQSPPAPPDHLFTSSLLKLFYMKEWVQRIHPINYMIKWNCWLPGKNAKKNVL